MTNQEEDDVLIFPHLRLLNLNGLISLTFSLADNPLGNDGVKQLFKLLEHHSLPDLQQLFLISTYSLNLI